MKTTILLPFLLASLATGAIGEVVPALFNFRTEAVTAAGAPLPDGNYDMEFRVWNGPGGAAELVWGARYQEVPCRDGHLDVLLGSATGEALAEAPVSDLRYAFEESERYLGVCFLTDESGQAVAEPMELAPRTRVLSAPFAIRALNAPPAGAVFPYAGTADSVPDGWLLCDGQAYSETDHPRLFATIGTSFNEVGTPSGMFQVPDMRSRAMVGTNDPAAGGLSTRVLASKDGAERYRLKVSDLPDHRHGLRLPFEIKYAEVSTRGIGRPDWFFFHDVYNGTQPGNIVNQNTGSIRRTSSSTGTTTLDPPATEGTTQFMTSGSTLSEWGASTTGTSYLQSGLASYGQVPSPEGGVIYIPPGPAPATTFSLHQPGLPVNFIIRAH